MKLFVFSKSNFSSILILILITGSLINYNYFLSPTSFAFYIFCIGSGILSIIVLTKQLYQNKKLSLTLSAIFLLLYCFYPIIHGALIEKLQSWHYYMLSIACFFIAVYLLQSEEIINKKLVCNGLVLLAIVESVVCILQATGFVPSMSRYLQVSGSWINPNVTAMFMTLVLPLLLLKLMGSSGQKRWFYTFIALLLFTGLYLLKCRSAYIGAFAATAVCLYFYYDVPQRIKRRRFRIVTIAISAILLVTAIPLIKSLYLSKQASADGRLLIYKVSAVMVGNKPISGYGYGQFEKYYNLEQAAYLASDKVSTVEIQNAGHVNMAYNEFLQHGVEGGIPGLLLFTSLMFILLVRGYFVLQISESRDTLIIASYAGIVAYASMSFINFTLQAIPVTLVFLLYTAVISSNNSLVPFRILRVNPILTALLLFASFGLLNTQLEKAIAMHKTKIAQGLIKRGNAKQAMKILKPLSHSLQLESSYWEQSANAQMQLHQYNDALQTLNTAWLYSSKPEICYSKAKCYEMQNQYLMAEEEYQLASQLEPMRMRPYVALMKLYQKSHEYEKARLMAQYLISFKPKIESGTAKKYKQQASLLLAQNRLSKY